MKVRAVLPYALRKILNDTLHVHAADGVLRRLESWGVGAYGDASTRAKSRWRAVRPESGLTMGTQMTGDAFIEKVASYGAFGEQKRILEIGPGYGRLPTAVLKAGVPFKQYVGLDLSEENVRFLSEKFTDSRFSFMVGDIEEIVFDSPFDTVISSMTLKHLYPTLEQGLTNMSRFMNEGGLALFDVIEGSRRHFEIDEATYVRWYTRDELAAILQRAGLSLLTFDYVQHTPEQRRMLVVARRG